MAEGSDGAHQTPTHDIIAVLEGELTLIMGNGDSANLHAGDVVIQLSGMHRWSNPTEQPARIFFVSLPSAPVPERAS
jgi:quercetin dioxygenase-like cupin family protein